MNTLDYALENDLSDNVRFTMGSFRPVELRALRAVLTKINILFED